MLRRATEQVDGWLQLLDELLYDQGRRDELAYIDRQRGQRLTS